QRLKKVTLCNVIYEPTQQINFMFSHLKLLADSLLAAGFDFNDEDAFIGLLGPTGTIEGHCAVIKDHAFKEENELRLVVPNFRVSSDRSQIRYRARNNLIVPYIEIAIEYDAISEIVIGPGPDRDIRKKNIEHYLKLIEIDVPMRFSSCQFR